MPSIQLKNTLSILFMIFIQFSFAQKSERISTVDFVQIVNDNREEAVFYYQHNWKILREMALEKNYISSFEIMETSYSEEAPFHFMLMTTYTNKLQYETREQHFQELIKLKGKLELLNDKKPTEFRKTRFRKENVMHQN